MKRILLLIMFFPFLSFGQGPGDMGNYSSQVGLGLGYVPNGIGVSLNFDYYINRFDYYQAELLFSFASDEVSNLKIKVPYDSFLINGGYFREVARLNRDVYTFKIGGGASLGYQIINGGNKELSSGALIKSDSKFLYGLFIGTEAKIYISEYFQASVKYKQFYHPNSEIGSFTPYIAASIIYSLY